MGRHCQREQVALFQRLGDGMVEILAGSEELIVPDGNIPAKLALMDQAHQGLGFPAVLFSITQKNIGVKGSANLGG